MAEPRRIVPDTSVLIGAMFPYDKQFPFERAFQLINAVMNHNVVCFAPDLLLVEFLKAAFDKRGKRRSSNIGQGEVEEQLASFLKMPIVYISSENLVTQAIEHCRRNSISPTDAWFLAAAETYQAELWISHDHSDGFARNAREAYGQDNVFTLERNDFYKAGRSRMKG